MEDIEHCSYCGFPLEPWASHICDICTDRLYEDSRRDQWEDLADEYDPDGNQKLNDYE